MGDAKGHPNSCYAKSKLMTDPSELATMAWEIHQFFVDALGYSEEDGMRQAAKRVMVGLADLEARLEAAERERDDLMRAVSRFIGSDENGQEMYDELFSVWTRLAAEGGKDG